MKTHSFTMNPNPRHRILSSCLSALAIALASAVFTVAFTASSAHAAISIAPEGVGESATGISANADAASVLFTNVVVSGSNNMLIVGVSGEDTGTLATPPSFTVTWGTDTITTSAITQVSSSDRNYSAIYVLSGLTAGTGNLTVANGTSTLWRAGFVSLTSADGPLGIAQAIGNGGSGTSFSLNFAEDTGDMFVFGAANWNSSTPATTDLAENLGAMARSGNDFGISMDYENTPGGTSFTYTGANNRAAITGIAVEVVPEPSAALLIGFGGLLPLIRRRR